MSFLCWSLHWDYLMNAWTDKMFSLSAPTNEHSTKNYFQFFFFRSSSFHNQDVLLQLWKKRKTWASVKREENVMHELDGAVRCDAMIKIAHHNVGNGFRENKLKFLRFLGSSLDFQGHWTHRLSHRFPVCWKSMENFAQRGKFEKRNGKRKEKPCPSIHIHVVVAQTILEKFTWFFRVSLKAKLE